MSTLLFSPSSYSCSVSVNHCFAVWIVLVACSLCPRLQVSLPSIHNTTGHYCVASYAI